MSSLIYGAYGYTGRLISREAVRRGMKPILAGRSASRLRSMGDAFELPTRTVSLEQSGRLRSVLNDVRAVLHCAGPFVETAAPMVNACLDTGTHYMDLTGEVDVFRAIAARDGAAEEADVMLLPGIGFDVVPSDCLARYVADQASSASTLEIALFSAGGVSRGTLKTLIEHVGKGGLVRRQGTLQEVPHGWTSRTVDFGDRDRWVASIPEGSVVTTGFSTGVPNVTAYMAFPQILEALFKMGSVIQPLLRWPPVRQLLKKLVEYRTEGPTAEQRQRGRTEVWASARSATGAPVIARLHGPEAYTFTARTATAALEQLLDGTNLSGFQTPATAFGPDLPLEVEGVRREDVAVGDIS